MNTAYFTVTPQEFFHIADTEQDVKTWAEWIPNEVRKELLKMGGGIIWWRIKPEWDHAKIGYGIEKPPSECTDEEKSIGENYFCWKGYMRFATSPPLSENAVTRLTVSHDTYREQCAQLRLRAIEALKEPA